MKETAIREQLSRLLSWEDAHAGFEAAVDGIPPELRGKQPAGLPYSPWQLLEHLRITQHDILNFCVNAKYEEMAWPDDYWPKAAAPPHPTAWDESVKQFQRDRQAVQALAHDASTDLNAKIPHGSGQTYLREIVLVADHTAYHVGQLILVRRLLGIWPAK
ncbi:MAG TPA: DinB family protein [Vicinamibacterales bacterium]|nr:DinB family protein [Vicinamibacterales bacterium]